MRPSGTEPLRDPTFRDADPSGSGCTEHQPDGENRHDEEGESASEDRGWRGTEGGTRCRHQRNTTEVNMVAPKVSDLGLDARDEDGAPFMEPDPCRAGREVADGQGLERPRINLRDLPPEVVSRRLVVSPAPTPCGARSAA